MRVLASWALAIYGTVPREVRAYKIRARDKTENAHTRLGVCVWVIRPSCV